MPESRRPNDSALTSSERRWTPMTDRRRRRPNESTSNTSMSREPVRATYSSSSSEVSAHTGFPSGSEVTSSGQYSVDRARTYLCWFLTEGLSEQSLNMSNSADCGQAPPPQIWCLFSRISNRSGVAELVCTVINSDAFQVLNYTSSSSTLDSTLTGAIVHICLYVWPAVWISDGQDYTVSVLKPLT